MKQIEIVGRQVWVHQWSGYQTEICKKFGRYAK